MANNYIRPIVEFFPLSPVESKRGAKWELFTDLNEDESTHKYYSGVKDALRKASGVYLFYDSRGRALYAGKAVRQNLWQEMNNVYNRSREVQKLRLVSHPTNNVAYRLGDERVRRIQVTQQELHDLACYVSAYEISPKEMISMFEALLIRAFANDLLNTKMENF